MQNEVSITITSIKDGVKAFALIKQAAHTIGMGPVRQTQLITASSELITNMIKYAGNGTIFVRTETRLSRGKIVIKATDQGPGIENIAEAMTRGFSTGKTLGLGLPGARQLSDEFSIESRPGVGTTVIISKWA